MTDSRQQLEVREVAIGSVRYALDGAAAVGNACRWPLVLRELRFRGAAGRDRGRYSRSAVQ